MKYLWLLFLLASCGYRFEGSGEKISIAIPYVIGDSEGELTAALIQQVAQSPYLLYSHGEAQRVLNIKIVDIKDDRIGFRYDRNPETGKRRKQLEGIENRRQVTAEVLLVSSENEEVIYGPRLISATIDYDYVDPNSLQDLSLVSPSGALIPSESFSLGQLDTIEAAKTDSLRPLYRKLAQKIVNEILTANF